MFRVVLCAPVLLLLLSVGLNPVAQAGMSVEEMLVDPQRYGLTPEEEVRRRELIERQYEEARERRQAQEAEQRERAQRERERRAALPREERLMEDNCVVCHAAGTLERAPRSRLSWEAVILRMEWLHGVQLQPGERADIAHWLATEYPAPMDRVMRDYLILIVFPLLVFGGLSWALWRGTKLWRARRTRAGKEHQP